MDTVFQRLKAHGFADWGAIKFALSDQGATLANPLDPDEVGAFAEMMLEELNPQDPGFDEIASLALDHPATREEARERVSSICDRLGFVSGDDSNKKWRSVELEWLLDNLDTDAVYALIQISSFWSRWGWPADAPISASGAATASEGGYGAPSELASVVREQRDWLSNELARLASRHD